jgi:hypothetical protein
VRMKKTGIVASALLLVSVVLLFFGHRQHTESPLPFDPKAWKREEPNQRLRMVSDLKPKLMGMTKTQLEGMLGESRTDVGELLPGYRYTYLLGTQQRLLDEDGIWLCIKFQNSLVSDVQVLRGE